MTLRRRELYLSSVVGHRPERSGGVVAGGSPFFTTIITAGSGTFVAARTGRVMFIGVGGGCCGSVGASTIGGGGGGSGAGAVVTVNCNKGDSFAWVVGAGGTAAATPTGASTTVANPSSANILTAVAGTAGVTQTGGTGGLAGSCTGDFAVNGGSGFTVTVGVPGGGGGSPPILIFPLVAGVTSLGNIGGVPGGGNGGLTSGQLGTAGSLPGAGAGGSARLQTTSVTAALAGGLVIVLF